MCSVCGLFSLKGPNGEKDPHFVNLVCPFSRPPAFRGAPWAHGPGPWSIGGGENTKSNPVSDIGILRGLGSMDNIYIYISSIFLCWGIGRVKILGYRRGWMSLVRLHFVN